MGQFSDNMEKINDEPETPDISESDTDRDRDKTPQTRHKVSLMEDKKNNLLLSNRLSDSRGKDDIHVRAKKLKDHYKAVQACDQIMAYGFVIILFLLTGFYWFIIIFNEEIRHTFHNYHVIAPTFVFGTISLGALNMLVR